MEMIQFKPFR